MDGKLDTVRRGLEIADAFCGKHTADECPDTVAIPIKEAMSALSAIDPEAIRLECARAARNAIFNFGIDDKASDYYSLIIRKELAVQLVERAILGAEPAQDDGKQKEESLQETLDRLDGYGIDNECGARG